MLPIVPLVICICVSSIVTPFALYKLRKVFFRKERAGREYLNTTVFSLFNTMYAFFVGFSIVTLWGAFSTAKNSVAMEASAMHSVAKLSLPLERSSEFRQDVRTYLESVVTMEWPEMEKNASMSAHTAQAFDKIWDSYKLLLPTDKLDNPLYAALGGALTRASELRTLRSTYLSGNLYPLVWITLGVGFCAVLVSIFVVNSTNDSSKITMEIFLLFLFISCIYLAYDIATPYSGVVLVESTPFKDVLESPIIKSIVNAP